MLILASLFVSQLSYRDIEFEKVQIDCIIQIAKVRDYNNVLPWRHAALLRQLDCNHFECRKLATDELVNMGELGLPIILWGTHSKSPEIKSKCKLLLDIFYKCPICEGYGYCETCIEHQTCIYSSCPEYIKHIKKKPEHSNFIGKNCFKCTGTGDMRYLKYDKDIIILVPAFSNP